MMCCFDHLAKGPMWVDALFSPSEYTSVLRGVNNGLEHGGPPSIKRSQYALVLHFTSEQGNFEGGTCSLSQYTLVLHWRNPLVLERILDQNDRSLYQGDLSHCQRSLGSRRGSLSRTH